VVTIMDFIFFHLEYAAETCQDETDTHYRVGIDLAFSKLNEYYIKSDSSTAYRAAIILNPALKCEYIETHWHGHHTWIKSAKNAVRALWEREKGRIELDITIEQDADKENTPEYIDIDMIPLPGDAVAPPGGYPPPQPKANSLEDPELMDFDTFLHHQPTPGKAAKRKVLDEYEKYLSFPADPAIKDPIKWWKANLSVYPVLGRMALNLLAIPGMSSQCERVFSDTSQLITDERNRFGPEMLEAEECLRSWLKFGLISISADGYPGLQ